MSSRYEVSKRHTRSRSRSPERRDHRSKHRETSTKSKHKSKSRERDRKHERSESKHNKGKKKKKKRSSSSSSSDSDEQELKLLQRLEAERLRLKEEKMKQKELMKQNETPEEKRARRLRQKQEKEHKRRERMGWDNEYQCYTNQDNPFGDSALTNTFVWTKKLAKEGVKNVSHDELEALNRQKQLENKIELEKVKQRRLEREAERAAREAEALSLARAREAQQLSGWGRREDLFHLQQARLRSRIRIRDARAKPIDLLAWYVSSEECVDALEMHEPYTYLNGLQAQDLEDLLEDIKVYKELEAESNQCYWSDVQTIVEDELGKLRRLRAPDTRDGVHHAVAEDVAQIFKGKSGAQLEALQRQIEQKISGRRDGVDIGYWESLLSQLKAHMSRARLRDRHQTNLRRKLQLLKQEQGVQPGPSAEPAKEEPGEEPVDTGAGNASTPCDSGAVNSSAGNSSAGNSNMAGASSAENIVSTPPESIDDSHAEKADSSAEGSELEEESLCVSLYVRGRYSPPPLAERDLEAGTLLSSPQQDLQRLAYLRGSLRGPAANTKPTTSSTLSAPEEALAAAMGPLGAQFSVEHTLPDQPCLWADKYRPRKPRYFNRVHTGFEWNKYNQTHYDMDNPPPKIVQGYKFNIFYPDLIEPNSTPEFSLKPCPDNAEFAVLRFHAGPPYEDIAFKIVNREWEYSYKRGFRCHFHNNIFQLWFHFKRYRYRR